MIKATGKLLIFDKPDKCKRIFSKDSEMTFPVKVPVVLGFKIFDPGSVVGHAENIKKFTDHISCDLVLHDSELKYLIKDDELYMGGYYNKVKTHKSDNGSTIIDSANLCGVGLTTILNCADNDLKLYLKEESDD